MESTLKEEIIDKLNQISESIEIIQQRRKGYTIPIKRIKALSILFLSSLLFCGCQANQQPSSPYLEHLYVQPGDSIHLEIDFKDMLNPVKKWLE